MCVCVCWGAVEFFVCVCWGAVEGVCLFGHKYAVTSLTLMTLTDLMVLGLD